MLGGSSVDVLGGSNADVLGVAIWMCWEVAVLCVGR